MSNIDDTNPHLNDAGHEDAASAGTGATPDGQPKSEPSEAKSAASRTSFRLFSLAKVPLVQPPDFPDQLYAEVPSGTARVLVPVGSPRVHAYLNQLMDEFTGGDPDAFLTKAEFQDHGDFFRAKASRTAKRRPVFKRVAWLPDDGAIWIDLARDDGLAVRITAGGWTIEEPLHPLFVRFPTQRALPLPEETDDGEVAFRSILPPGISDDDAKLLLGAILACFVPSTFAGGTFSYPVIVLTGDAGSGKSTLAKTIKRLVDNEVTTVASKPRSVDDLFVDASTAHLVSYDNIVFVGHSLSDGMAQLVTGSAVTKRKLYTDGDRAILYAHVPVLLNGIDVDMPKSDLLDRSIHVHLARIETYDADITGRSAPLLGQVMGYLCTLLARALRNYASTTVPNAPRLSLVAKLCAAAEPFGCATPFVDLLRAGQHEALLSSRDNDLVVAALFELVSNDRDWTGTYKNLLATLSSAADDRTVRSPEWPTSPHKLARHMREHARLMRAQGLDFENGRKTEHGRIVTVRRVTPSTDPDGVLPDPAIPF